MTWCLITQAEGRLHLVAHTMYNMGANMADCMEVQRLTSDFCIRSVLQLATGNLPEGQISAVNVSM
jgi:hypothetical protein